MRLNGFSIGSAQRGEPRGILRGDFLIAKWRNLTPSERAECDGQLIGNGRNDPVTIQLFKKFDDFKEEEAP